MKKISTFVLGLVVGVSLASVTAVGASSYLKAIQSNVSLIVNGEKATLSDKPMNINGRLYLPVRDTANALGYSINSVTSSSVGLSEYGSKGSSSVTSNNNQTSTSKPSTQTGDKYVTNLHEKFSTDGKLDANKIKLGIAAGEITINSQDSNGKSILHYVVEENNFAVYQVIKLNGLNVNLTDSNGQTPLHIAVEKENRFFLGELTSTYKSDATIKDKNQKQPIDLAEQGSSIYNNLKIYMF